MYLVDFFKRLGRKANIPVVVYLILNVVIISGMMCLFFGLETYEGVISGLILYILSLVIALSPIGEWILRIQTGCKEIKNIEMLNYIQPIFNEVYEKAKVLDPSISNGVKLYMSDDDCPNAFATGRKTVCVTRGMTRMPQDQIRAALGHEFGHLAHKDTDLILLVSVGNLIVSGFIIFLRVCIEVFHLFLGLFSILFGGKEGFWMAILTVINRFMIITIVSGLTWLWTKIGILLVMKSSRSKEYEADAFSFHLGYGNELCMLLDNISGFSSKGLFANLMSSHPGKLERIERLQQLGTTYSLY